MSQEIPFTGFAYDERKALGMADSIMATLAIATGAGVTVPDRLAALGIAVARTILQSKLDRAPEVAITRLADYTRLVVAQLQEAARRQPPPPTPG